MKPAVVLPVAFVYAYPKAQDRTGKTNLQGNEPEMGSYYVL